MAELKEISVKGNDDVTDLAKKVRSAIDFPVIDSMIDNYNQLGKYLPDHDPPVKSNKYVPIM